MTDGAETIHVVFGRSTADTLRAALPLMGGVARVIGLCDNLGVGPIEIAGPGPGMRDIHVRCPVA